MLVILFSYIIAILNTIATHILLTRKRSIKYCIVTFFINTIIVYGCVYLAEKTIHNSIILNYTLSFSAFLYIIYIQLIFKETISKKIFTMFSIWIFSISAFVIASVTLNLFGTIRESNYIKYYIYFVRISIQILLLYATYFWICKPYKKILSIVTDKTINLMSFYPITAFLLLINKYEEVFKRVENFNDLFNILLFLVFIISGYLLVFVGISSTSKIISLQYELKTVETQAKLQYYAANFDNLTGIANRHNIMNQLDKSIEISNKNNYKFALMIFDLDKFKKINDVYGHLAGDKVLKYVAQIVQNVLKNTDYIGRFGGDEFVIIQQFINDKSDVEILINKIFEELKTPLIIDDNEILINISVGASVFPDDTSDLENLIHKADSAMYEAKRIEGCTFKI
jgi:diguanylate cyclase (GGDEF)-like protein